MSQLGKGILVNTKIAKILNRKMKVAGYKTTIGHLKNQHGMNIISNYGGAVQSDCSEISQMIVDSYDEAYPEQAYERMMEEKYYG